MGKRREFARAVPLLLVAGALSSCGDDREVLAIGTMSFDGARIAVHGHCHDGRRLEAAERGDRIELTFSVEAASGGDCFDCVVIELQDPVGEREVFDTETDAPVKRDGDPALQECFDRQ